VDCAHGRAVARPAQRLGELAYHLYTFQPLEPHRSLAGHLATVGLAQGSLRADDRLDRGASASACGGGPKKEGEQALGRSRGGLSTKIHACCDARGQVVRCVVSAGQEADIVYAQALIEGIETQALLADKGYDANELLQVLREREIEAVIPPKRNRLEQRGYDRQAYKHRNLVERMFNRLKQFRRVATRYDKLARNFLGMLSLACWLIGVDG